MSSEKPRGPGRVRWGGLFSKNNKERDTENGGVGPSKWSMGILNDPDTVEVPGSVLLLAAHRNEPLGLRNVHARTSHASIPAGFPVETPPMTPGGTRPMPGHSPATSSTVAPEPVNESDSKKKTGDGTIILEPQPDDSANDPLNWPSWRRDMALLSLGLYCMIGGGITPLIAAGFTDVAKTYDVDVERVPLTTGLYMMGLGLGSVVFSPTAILYGKRPIYLFSSIIFIGTSLWAAWSPTFNSLLAARVFQGVAVSPVECLPSATIAEIFFLHERAYRIGIYTLLLLSGKNLVPLVSAAIIGRFGWRWVFWIVAMVVALAGVLLFFFVPETFWDRTPTRKPSKRPSFLRRLSSHHGSQKKQEQAPGNTSEGVRLPMSPGAVSRAKDLHVGFAPDMSGGEEIQGAHTTRGSLEGHRTVQAPEAAYHHRHVQVGGETPDLEKQAGSSLSTTPRQTSMDVGHSIQAPHDHQHHGHHASSAGDTIIAGRVVPTIHLTDHAHERDTGATSPRTQEPGSPYYNSAVASEANVDYFAQGPNLDHERISASSFHGQPKVQAYTHNLRQQPAASFTQQLKIWNGRLNNDKWLKVMVRPFILAIYPCVAWSSIVYACSIGWLIVISETVAVIYRDPTSYNFSALGTGLVYISPFIGGVLGTGVAGKISDVIVKVMARRNGGLYEPEFRLVMAIPILITTCIGLMGFGWSVEEKDHWIVPTFFFGVISFGCSLGSTTSITFCVDSYRQYAGEALVTLNFTKNVCHGLVFSLFVSHWLDSDGPKMVYIWIGVIQLIVLLTTIPMYIYGKRARMWTARKNFMEKF